MGNPIILYDDVMADGTLSATSEESGTDVLDIVNFKGYEFWQADSLVLPQYLTSELIAEGTADALGLFGHNFGTLGLEISVESANDDPDGSSGVDLTERLAGFTPSDDKAILKTFSSASDLWWRLKMDKAVSLDSADDPPYLAVLMIGQLLQFPNAQKAPLVLRDQKPIMEITRARKGQHLATVRSFTELMIDVRIPVPTSSWIDNTFLTFWDNHASQGYPFFFAWDLDTYPDLIYWAVVEENFRFQQPFHTAGLVTEIRLKMRATKEE